MRKTREKKDNTENYIRVSAASTVFGKFSRPESSKMNEVNWLALLLDRSHINISSLLYQINLKPHRQWESGPTGKAQTVETGARKTIHQVIPERAGAFSSTPFTSCPMFHNSSRGSITLSISAVVVPQKCCSCFGLGCSERNFNPLWGCVLKIVEGWIPGSWAAGDVLTASTTLIRSVKLNVFWQSLKRGATSVMYF